ncbi:MAG: hypothetical protein PVH00_02955 [Gemmatimonadota bacterium]|jgi:hypothetical protein
MNRKRLPSIRRCAATVAAALLVVPALAAGQGAGLAVRAGAVASTALAEDLVANPGLGAALGGVGAVRAVPAPGVLIEVAGSVPMKARTRLELDVGWSHATLEARDDEGTREIQPLGALHAALSVRYLATTRTSGSCGFGVIRYLAEERALFAGGTEISPLVQCAARFDIAGPPGRRVFIRAGGQLHQFRTPVLVDAGAQAGTVYRLVVEAGVDFGRKER